MARNNTKKRNVGLVGNGGERTDWKAPENARFANVYLNDADQQWLMDNQPNSDDVVATLYEGASHDAARISVVPDARSGRFNATYTTYDVNSPRYGIILSVRAASPFVALYALAYAVIHKPDAWRVTSTQPGGLFN